MVRLGSGRRPRPPLRDTPRRRGPCGRLRRPLLSAGGALPELARVRLPPPRRPAGARDVVLDASAVAPRVFHIPLGRRGVR